MSAQQLVIFNDTHGWHSEQLIKALSEYHIEVTLSDLANCYVDLDHPHGFVIPELDGMMPAAVLVRGIAPGSLEQITLRMDFLHTLTELGIPVLNTAKTIEHTVDKARTSLRLHMAGLNTPATWTCENNTTARHIAQQQFSLGHQLVIKPLFGCQGKGIIKISTLDDLEQADIVGQVFYLQRYIEPYQAGQWQDWRLMVIDGEVCAAMSRHADHWITNYAQGGQCLPTTVSEELHQLAVKACQAVEADYAGVDLIRAKDGQYSILEVNSVPAWKGLYQATDINIAYNLAASIAKRIKAQLITEHA